MGLAEVQQRMAEANEAIAKLREELNEKSKEAFSEAVKELFTMHPNLVAFRWSQYTPYFNDGDECVFSAGEVYVKLDKPVPQEEVDATRGLYCDDYPEYEDGTHDQWLNGWVVRDRGEVSHPAMLVITDCNEVRNMIDEEALKDMFGDHVTVTVTKDGVETSDCEHE